MGPLTEDKDFALLKQTVEETCEAVNRIEAKVDTAMANKADKSAVDELWTHIGKMSDSLIPKWIAIFATAAISTIIALLGIIGVLLSLLLRR